MTKILIKPRFKIYNQNLAEQMSYTPIYTLNEFFFHSFFIKIHSLFGSLLVKMFWVLMILTENVNILMHSKHI